MYENKQREREKNNKTKWSKNEWNESGRTRLCVWHDVNISHTLINQYRCLGWEYQKKSYGEKTKRKAVTNITSQELKRTFFVLSNHRLKIDSKR